MREPEAEPETGAAPDHALYAALAVPGGFQGQCACGWRSAVVPDPYDFALSWEEHLFRNEQKDGPSVGEH